ncbi:MAG: CRTAC1 family protein, partial [Verrucomicrobia bacterium]|nr:CRTAC1 family protein [Verrucomicrobiota bacterium]
SPILSIRKTSLFSMGVDFADINADGFDDFVLLDMLPRDLASRTSRLPDRSPLPPSAGEYATRLQTGRNTLFISRQDGTYAEVANWAGVSASDWAWCPLFLDVDLDARPDLLVGNGNLRDNRNADVVGMLSRMRVEKKLSAAGVFESRKLAPPILVPNNAFRNRGDGSFEEVGATWGFSSKAIAHGMACADLDNDGDLDVVVNTLNSIGEVYRNNASAGRILVRLKGLSPNTSAIGAMIRVSGGGLPSQQQEIQAGGRYLSSDDAARSFAASGAVMRVEVWWPGGRRSLVEPVPADCILEIDQPGPGVDPVLASRPNKVLTADPFFDDVSQIVSFRHQDRDFDDFARQPLQPWKLSQLGPGVSWWDANGDGFDDLIVGSGKGGVAGILLNREGKQFLASTQHHRILQTARDQTTLLPHPGIGGDPRLLVGLASFEDGLAVLASVQSLSLSQNRVYDAIPGGASSLGPLALADVDLDGDLDLFAGGRVIPGRYPSAASSRLFRFQEGRFVEDPIAGERLQTLGLVSDAVFSDLDGDGDPDLVVACEWGAVRVLLNDQSKWRDVTDAWGLGGFVGLWNGVTTGDFDGDGRLDIAASNWGMNTHYSAHTSTNHPVQLVWGEWSGNGMDVLETEWDADRGHYAPMRGLDVVSRSLPFVRDAASSHRAYASTSVEMLLGERFQAAQTSKASWLRSAVFLNRGDRFEVRSLGGSADWSPSYGICVGDFDGDGRQDLFLSQNFSGVPTDQVRLDSGCGVWMRGQGG